ncbi:MAG: carbohydrate kinase family protein [Candidatus Sumerlaeia bacterium]
MSECDIVAAGHLCLDMIPRFSDDEKRRVSEILAPGSLTKVGECVIGTGGAVSNTGIALKKMGLRVIFMGKIGDDTFGKAVLAKMAEDGCDEGIIVDPDSDTSYTIVISPPNSDRLFLHNHGANDTFCADDLDYEQLEKARAFHFGYPSLMRAMVENDGAQLVDMFRRVKERGLTTSLDMSQPDPESFAGKANWPVIFEKLLPHVDIFLPSVEEILLCLKRDSFLQKRKVSAEKGCDMVDLFKPDEYAELSDRLLCFGTGMTTLKSGYRGIYLRTGSEERLSRFGKAKPADMGNWANREVWEPVYRVDKIASAVGSGDSAIAGFLCSFLKGQSLEKSLQYATAAGKLNVMVHDATSGIKSFDEITALLAEWEKAPFQIDAPGWREDSRSGLWYGPHDHD